MTAPLRVLAVDDEAPALDELTYLLGRHADVGEVKAARDATSALRLINECRLDAVFLDIEMPGLSGLELAAVLANFTEPPAVVFVTAHDDRAVEAFDVGAADYLLKPVHEERLDAALRRIRSGRIVADRGTDSDGDTIPVELGGVTELVRCETIGWVEADGDYARLHTASGSHLVRIPLSTLADRWRDRGFVRVHRSYLVAVAMVTGLRHGQSATMVRLRANGASPAVELPVSRRQSRELRDRLIRNPMRSFRNGSDD
jgi:DNA-binding LytR/AlgR family response regulator